MTGYGKGAASENGATLTVEIKSVNHRFLDYGLKLPRNFLFVEDEIKKRVSEQLSRGHVDIFLTYEKPDGQSIEYVVDNELAASYALAAKTLAKTLKGVKNDFTITDVLRNPDIVKKVQKQEDDGELRRELALSALSDALSSLKEMRKKEGEALKLDILSKLAAIEKSLAAIKELAPTVAKEYAVQLKTRIGEIMDGAQVDEARLATEIALFADHCCIDEEITRLGTHIEHMKTLMEADEPVGRKMDFLVQEFNREANTIGSKANNINITKEVLAIKNEIEKMREQAANIE